DVAELQCIPYEEILASRIVANISCKELLSDLIRMQTSTNYEEIKRECLAWESSEQTRYSVGELEALAMQYAISLCRAYLRGLPHFSVIVDHKLLESIANNPNLASVDNPRMQNILEKTVVADVDVVLCRQVCFQEDPDSVLHDLSLDFIIKVTHKDTDYQASAFTLRNTSQHQLNCLPQTHSARTYIKDWNDLSLSAEGLVLKNSNGIFVPPGARQIVLHLLHVSHQGHGMGNQIRQMVEECDTCQKYRPCQRQETLIYEHDAEYPFQTISVDLFKYGGLLNAGQTIRELKAIFVTCGVPVKLQSNGGLQFASAEFQDFCLTFVIVSSISSAHYAQSNGHAEAAVKAMKLLVKKCWINGHFNMDHFHLALANGKTLPEPQTAKHLHNGSLVEFSEV
ncbi:hypothetical protein TCAL_03488, partial [Tigriopus californicus]